MWRDYVDREILANTSCSDHSSLGVKHGSKQLSDGRTFSSDLTQQKAHPQMKASQLQPVYAWIHAKL